MHLLYYTVAGNEVKTDNLDGDSKRMKRNECTRSRCPTNSTTDVNVVAIATITPIVGGIPILISVIILCWICGGCKATKEYCEGCCECCFDGCVRCVKVFDLRTYSRNTTTRYCIFHCYFAG